MQHWTLVDHDGRCWRRPSRASRAWADTAECRGAELALSKGGKQILVRLRRADLARDLESVLEAEADLVTASALFDLASADFIAEIAAAIARSRAPSTRCSPTTECSAGPPSTRPMRAMASAFRRHQAGDKGFGAAGGTDGAGAARRRLRRGGLLGERGRQRLAPGGRRRGADRRAGAGFAAAVRETGLVPDAKVADWLAVSRTGALVGHTDTLALPP